MSLVRLRVPLGFVAAAAYLALARPTPASLVLGVPFVLAGEAIRLWASGTITKNRALTTGGPYRRVRHPLYLGSAALVLGFALASGSPGLGLGLAIAFAAVYLPVARTEEGVLAGRYGAEYERYRAAVPAFLPVRRAWSGGEEAGFSWAAIRRHREWRAVLGTLALLGYLVVRAGR